MATFPTNQLTGSATTLIISSGALKASVGTIITSYASTAAADSNAYIKDYAGADIVIANDNRYYRNQAASAWILHFTSTNFSTGNLSPLFTASIVNPTTAPVLTFAQSLATNGTVFGANGGGATSSPIFTADPTLGVANTTRGSLTFFSDTGGSSVVRLIGSSGNYNFNLPLSAGTVGQALLSGGGGSNPHTYGSILTSITADNGLTANTATNVRWGGTLLQNTTVDAISTYSIIFDNALFVVQGPANDTGLNPPSGAGTRMVFCPKRSAFRAGNVSSTQWDAANMGYYSIALGDNPIASGTYSFATQQGQATGLLSTGMAGGFATADYSFAVGNGVIASAVGSFGFGTSTMQTGANGFSAGYWLLGKSFGGCVVGTYNDSTAATSTSAFNALNRAFQVGVGSSDGTRANALTILFNGKTTLNKYGVGTFTGTPAFNLQVDSSGNIIETESVVETASGLYTPTLTNVSNVVDSGAYECQYLRVGDVVTVSGKFTITFQIGGSVTKLGISLPIASSFAADQKCAGAANSNMISSGCFAVRADTTNGRAEFYAVAPISSLGETYWFTFTYYITPP